MFKSSLIVKTALAATRVAAVLLLSQCASSQPEPPRVVMRPMSDESLRGMTALDAEIEEITFKQVPIVTALMVLQRTHRAWPQKLPPFMWAIDAGPEASEAQQKNPKVTLKMKNVTFGAVFDELCQQTGWAKKVSQDGWRVDLFPTGILPDWARRTATVPGAAP